MGPSNRAQTRERWSHLSNIVAQAVNILGYDTAGIDAHAGEFLAVEGDEGLLTRVVTNLLTNALAVPRHAKASAALT